MLTAQKYTATGNDFVLFHAFSEQDRSQLAKKLCDRQYGVGADGLIVLLPHKKYDFEWQFYNSDGSVAAMCGNGSRAAAMYAFDNGLSTEYVRFLTGAGVIEATVDKAKGEVESLLGAARLEKESFDEAGYSWQLIDTGVPHLVAKAKDINEFDKTVAAAMRQKYNANVNFYDEAPKATKVRTFERGVEDETLACGTGMAAVFYSLICEGKLQTKTQKIVPKSGEEVTVRIVRDKLYLRGPVKRVFTAVLSEA